MKTFCTLLMLFLILNLFCQEILGIKSIGKSNYSENLKLKVFYSDKSRELHSDQEQPGLFVNEKSKSVNSIKMDVINFKYKVLSAP